MTPETVATYAPVAHFHENENSFPCSIEYLLQGATLLSHADPGFSLGDPTQANLQTYSDDQRYVSVAPSQYGGQVDPTSKAVTAPLYYAVQQYPDRVEISYVFLYAHQGGQTIHAYGVPHVIPEFDCIVYSLGVHQGDIERAVVKLATPPGASGYQVLGVGYEAHGDVSWYTPDQVSWEGTTHPLVHVALNGHSCHNELAQGDRIVEATVPGIVDVTANLSSAGTVWRPQQSDLKQLGLDASGAPVSDQVWAAYCGRLGVQQTNGFQGAIYFNGSGLNTLDWGFVKTFGTAASFLGILPPGAVDGNGARGPGARDWIRQPPTGDGAD